jgi:redox-sensitive bicupin YhaK (pirin superfamily)
MDGLVIATRPLGAPPWETADPFLFCVHHTDAYPRGNGKLGPEASLLGRNLGQDFEGKDGWRMYHGQATPGFPAHPHRGFETVTIVRSGLVDHADSLGASARYGRGDVQWLTAGAGISHSEMFPLVDSSKPNPLDLFQIWLNLPSAKKLVKPHFAMLWGRDIPRRTFADGAGRSTEVTLVAGELEGARPPSPPPESWAARADSDVAIWTLRMQPGARWTLPRASGAGAVRTLYFFRGSELRVGGEAVGAGRAIVLDARGPAPLEAGDDECELLLLQGRAIGEPVVQYGPFVMNSRAEIERAFADYQRTRFGGWPWATGEPVFPREDARFARYPDGRFEQGPG